MAKAKKIIRHSSRALLVLLLLIGLILGGSYAFINSRTGEKWMARQLSSMLEKQTGTLVDIGHLDVQLPNTVLLDSVVIRDHHRQVMFVLHHVRAKMGFLDLITNKLALRQVVLDGVDFNLIRYKGEPTSNLGMVIRELSPSDTTHTGNPMKILFQYVQIKDLNFRWDDYNQPRNTNPRLIDWDHIKVDSMNGLFTDLLIDGDNISARVKQLNLAEQSGFILNDLATNFTYTDGSMEFEHLLIQTPESHVTNYLKFNYASVNDFDAFIDSVGINANFYETKVSFRDIAFFTDRLINKHDIVALNSAEVKGTVANMNVRDLDANFGERSYITGKVLLKGLPNINETFIDAHLKAARSSRQELARVFPELPVPEEVEKLGLVSLKGDFTGFINDFVTYGTFDTELGRIKTDVNLKLADNTAHSTYSGSLELENFDIGKYTGDKRLGLVSIQGKVAGKGLELNNIGAKLESRLDRFDFNGYTYHNITVNGDISNKFFNGKLDVKDPNLDVNFTGTIDFKQQKPAFDFVADIQKANLKVLGLLKDSLSLSSRLDIKATGMDPDSIEGRIIAYDTRVIAPKKTYFFDSLDVASRINNTFREINVNTELFTAQLRGSFTPTQLPDLIKATLNKYIDSSFVHLDARPVGDQSLDFDIEFKNLEPLFTVLQQDIAVADSGFIRGSISTQDNRFLLDANIPAIKYGSYKARSIRIRGRGYDNTLSLGLTAGSFIYKDTMLMRDLSLKTNSNNQQVSFNFASFDQPHRKHLDLNGVLDIVGRDAYLRLDTSELKVGDTTWTIAAKPITIYGDTLVDVPLISFNSGLQSLKILGQYSPDHSYPIRAVMENMSIGILTGFAPQFRDFKGNLNGQVLISDINKDPIVEAAVFANPFIYGTDTIGYVRATANFDQSTNKLSIDGGLVNRNEEEMISANGYVDFNRNQRMKIDVVLNRTRLDIFEPVVSAVFSGLEGTATAKMTIEGTPDNPEIRGKADLDNVALTVDYLNTRYHFSDRVMLNGKTITIGDITLYDDMNHPATLSGSLDLSDIQNLGMNLRIDATDFHVLNTTQKDNELYYGQAFGTGRVNINGHLDNLRMYVKMKTEPNTVFSMPITQAASFTGYDFIRFTTSEKFLKENKKVDLSGLSLSMDLEVTPDALAQIIFDPRVGDILEARGNGNLRMDITTDGDFNMYGTYALTNGNYRFTAFDVINKSFDIKQGSTITWQGNPYEALLNVKAAYRLRTSLKPLLPATTSEKDENYYSRNYPVEAQLFLTGLLLSPDVKLDFEVQELNTSSGAGLNVAQSQIRNIKSNDQELTKQVVSLLVFNQFVPVNEGIGASEALSSGWTSGVGDLVSNQLNYWLSKISDDIQVGIDYRKQEELTLTVSKDFNKDRANISFAYDFTNNNYNAQGTYKLMKDGNTRVKVFSRSNNNPLFYQNSSTIGVGLFMRKEFNNWSDLLRKAPKPANTITPQKAPEKKQDDKAKPSADAPRLGS